MSRAAYRYAVLVTAELSLLPSGDPVEERHLIGPFWEEHTADAWRDKFERAEERSTRGPAADAETVGLWPGSTSASFVLDYLAESTP